MPLSFKNISPFKKWEGAEGRSGGENNIHLFMKALGLYLKELLWNISEEYERTQILESILRSNRLQQVREHLCRPPCYSIHPVAVAFHLNKITNYTFVGWHATVHPVGIAFHLTTLTNYISVGHYATVHTQLAQHSIKIVNIVTNYIKLQTAIQRYTPSQRSIPSDSEYINKH